MGWAEKLEWGRKTPVTVEEIASIEEPDELDDRVWTRVASRFPVGDPASVAALPDGLRAYVVTRSFEWECENGGLHQWFYNQPEPEWLDLILAGYAFLGLTERRDLLAEAVAPIAAREAAWRDSLRDGTIETFFASYPETHLSAYDDAFVVEDTARLRYLRSHPEEFAG
jgi:hypothetical protein